MISKKSAIIGIGNCGSQVADLAEKKYPDLFDSVFINTSEADLALVSTPDSPLKFKIGNESEVEGSGKDREKMKDYLQKDIFAKVLKNDMFQEAIGDKHYCFIVSSTAGGTGSGAAPIMYSILSQMFPDVHFILIFVLPQINASLMELGNTQDYLKEIYTKPTVPLVYMAYDNETVKDLSILAGPAKVNNEIVEDLRTISCMDNYHAQFSSIDMADMENIVTNPGRLIVARINDHLSDKDLEDTTLSDKFIHAIKHSCHAETDRNKKVDVWGTITYLTSVGYDLIKGPMESMYDFLGIPHTEYVHGAENTGKEELNFAYFLAGGLSPINDRAARIEERVEELTQAQSTNDDMSYIFSGDSVSYSDTIRRRKEVAHKNEGVEFDLEGIFQNFKK